MFINFTSEQFLTFQRQLFPVSPQATENKNLDTVTSLCIELFKLSKQLQEVYPENLISVNLDTMRDTLIYVAKKLSINIKSQVRPLSSSSLNDENINFELIEISEISDAGYRQIGEIKQLDAPVFIAKLDLKILNNNLSLAICFNESGLSDLGVVLGIENNSSQLKLFRNLICQLL